MKASEGFKYNPKTGMEEPVSKIKENKKENDVVNHPKHYCREGGMESIEEFELLYGGVATFYACLFNVHKYRYRAADKNGQEDLKKSDWYMRKLKEIKEKYGISLPPINVDYYD